MGEDATTAAVQRYLDGLAGDAPADPLVRDVEPRDGLVPAPPSSGSVLTTDARRILEAIDGLPEDEREVFNLVRVQGLTQPEAAEVLGVSSKTVQRRLNRALLLLAERLNDLRPAGSSPGEM